MGIVFGFHRDVISTAVEFAHDPVVTATGSSIVDPGAFYAVVFDRRIRPMVHRGCSAASTL